MRTLGKARPQTKLTVTFGAASFVLAVGLFATGAAVYGRDMGPAVFGGIAGIFAEAALVVLLLDRVVRLQEARDWAFVRETMGDRMAAAMVDVMRLAGIRWSALALKANRDRHAEFVGLAEVHLADLRSNLEGLALRAEPADYRAARRVELRLAWLLRSLRPEPREAVVPGPEWPIVVDTAQAISAFLRIDDSPMSVPGLRHDSAPSSQSQTQLMDAFWIERMHMQQQIHDLDTGTVASRGILFDIDGDLAVSYFALDAALIERYSHVLEVGSSPGH
jgi:hypothetical protein